MKIKNLLQNTTLSPVLKESLAHGAHVAKLANILFEGLSPLHGLNKHWQHILFQGATLHDIGWLYGKRAHHKASASMIRAGEVMPVDKKIRSLVALVARYHRRAEPSIAQWRFAALNSEDQKAIRILAAIIRLADALDFSHTSCVQDLRISIETDIVYINLTCSQDCAAEIFRIETKKELFCQIFNKDISCQAID